MKIKLDENIPVALGAILDACGHDTDTILEEELSGKPDPVVLAGSQCLVVREQDYRLPLPTSRQARRTSASATSF